MTKGPKGLAFITYDQPQDALVAFEALNGKPFQGRLLHIIGAVNPNSLKEQRSEKRRAAAGKEFNWGMLYMNVSEGPYFVALVYC
jgi:multiple RNA-binding domain-containing protein 1